MGGGDALLEHAHLLGQCRLVAHRGRHAAQQCRDFRSRQRVAIDVVDEHQHVAAFVAEVLGNGQAGERHAQAIARRLVHLAVHQRHLVDDAAVLHFMEKVVALAGPFAHAGEHRVTGMLDGDVADQLHQRHCLAHAGAAEQADLAALGNRHDEVDDLDACLQQFGGLGLVLVAGSRAVDGHVLRGPDGARFVDGVAQHVHDAAERLRAHRHHDRLAGIGNGQAPLQALRGAHGDGAHDAVAELLLHLQRQVGLGDFQRVIHLGNGVPRELHVHHCADDLHDFSTAHFLLSSAAGAACAVSPALLKPLRSRLKPLLQIFVTPLRRRPRFPRFPA